MLEGWPGEALLIKLIETLEKGIGALGEPYQIRRTEAARIEARRYELLVLAQAEVDAEDIRKGRKAINSDGELIALPAPDDTMQFLTTAPPNPHRNASQHLLLLNAGHQSNLALEFKRTINLRRIGVYAQEEAETMKQEPVSEAPVDPDWFARWRNQAQDVSSEQMQRLWAKILAGEVRQPGSFSVHSMDFLSRMSKSDADLLAKIARISIGNGIFKNAKKSFEALGINIQDLIYLDDIGILNGVVGVGGLSQTATPLPDPHSSDQWYVALLIGDVGLIFYKPTDDKTLMIPVHTISSIGKEILMLTKQEPFDIYIEEVAKFMKSKGYTKCQVGRKQWISGTEYNISGLKDYPGYDAL